MYFAIYSNYYTKRICFILYVFIYRGYVTSHYILRIIQLNLMNSSINHCINQLFWEYVGLFMKIQNKAKQLNCSILTNELMKCYKYSINCRTIQIKCYQSKYKCVMCIVKCMNQFLLSRLCRVSILTVMTNSKDNQNDKICLSPQKTKKCQMWCKVK